MQTYRGTALLLLDDDRQIAAGADLRKNDAGSWAGSLTFPAEAKTPELLNLTEGTLRIAGRDGKFNRLNTSDWIGSPAGRVRIRIEGNGDAPF
jgi:hypothetical protein